MRIVIIGGGSDPHVSAVFAHLSGMDVLLTDVAALAANRYVLHAGRLTVDHQGSSAILDAGEPARGWIRRLAPPDWQRGVVLESHDAAVKTAWLSLLTGVLRTCGVVWLSDVDSLVVSESKLVQAAAAKKIGIRSPTTVVTNDPAAAQDLLGREIVLKPLGPGHFFEDGTPHNVFASHVGVDGPELAAAGSAPFLAQQRLEALSHLRVVTVGDDLWAAELDATGRPLDWRSDPPAHRAFAPVAALEDDLATAAISIATELRLGYTSQDWVITDDGPYLLDVNPAGQWLFLPSVVAESVTAAIAAWLLRGVDD